MHEPINEWKFKVSETESLVTCEKESKDKSMEPFQIHVYTIFGLSLVILFFFFFVARTFFNYLMYLFWISCNRVVIFLCLSYLENRQVHLAKQVQKKKNQNQNWTTITQHIIFFQLLLTSNGSLLYIKN